MNTQKPTEVQMAMTSFEQYLALFTEKLKDTTLSKQSVLRAWANATLSPLNKEDLHFSYEEEKELFDLFTEANSCKLVLMMYGLADAGVIQIIKPLMTEMPKPDSEKLEEMGETVVNEMKEKGTINE